MYRKTKEERKAWWASLSDEKKLEYQHQWEHSRDRPDRVELNVKSLTKTQRLSINQRMREIGMSQYIVLPE